MPIRTLDLDPITSPSTFAVLDQLRAQHCRCWTVLHPGAKPFRSHAKQVIADGSGNHIGRRAATASICRHHRMPIRLHGGSSGSKRPPGTNFCKNALCRLLDQVEWQITPALIAEHRHGGVGGRDSYRREQKRTRLRTIGVGVVDPACRTYRPSLLDVATPVINSSAQQRNTVERGCVGGVDQIRQQMLLVRLTFKGIRSERLVCLFMVMLPRGPLVPLVAEA